MIDPLITIAIPFRGTWSYLREAVESVLAQTDQRWRMFVCDNASPEPGVKDRLLAYKDSRIFYVNSGVDLSIGRAIHPKAKNYQVFRPVA